MKSNELDTRNNRGCYKRPFNDIDEILWPYASIMYTKPEDDIYEKLITMWVRNNPIFNYAREHWVLTALQILDLNNTRKVTGDLVSE